MWPTIKQLASVLSDLKGDIDDSYKDEAGNVGIEVRLQVREDGWDIHTGDPQYDNDHRGWWGSGFLQRRTNSRELAKELREQARDAHAETKGVE